MSLIGAMLGTMAMGFFICIGFWAAQHLMGWVDQKLGLVPARA